MSLWEKPADPIDWKPMGGEATLAEIVASSFEAGRLAHSAIAESESIEQAFDERIDAIRAATGQSLSNPYRAVLPPVDPVGGTAEIYLAKVQDDWQGQLNRLAEKFPEHFDAIAPGRSILEDAGAIRRRAEDTSAAQFESRGGLAKYGAAFAGGFGASLRDPVQSSLLVLGGGPGAARTVGGRILEQAVVGAGTNAATEAAVQPFVQSGRDKAGLPSGIGPALADIGIAGMFGAVLAGGLQGGGELLGKVAARLGSSAEALPDEVRGAVAAIEADEAVTAVRPPDMPAETHDGVLAAAIDAAEDPAKISEAIARTESAAAEIARPKRTTRDAKGKPVSLFRFLAGAGGLMDHAGELRAMGLEKTLVGREGRLVRASGLDLDHAREIAAEAGYLDAKFGTPQQAMQQSTVADLLDLISEEAQGRRVYTLADQADAVVHRQPRDARFEASRSWTLSKLPEDIPAPVRERVAEIVHYDKMTVDDALERAFMEDYYGGRMPEPARMADEQEAPFFDDSPDPRGNADERRSLAGEGGGPGDVGTGPGAAAAGGGELPVSGGQQGSAGGEVRGTAGELEDALALPEASPFEPVTAGDPQTEAILATIEDPAGVTIADGVTLQAELDDIRHMEGMAGLVDACRLL